MERILITGGAGLIGSHLARRLVNEGHEVVCMDNLLTGRLENIQDLFGRPSFRFIRHDVTHYIHVPGPLDVIFHLASPASPQDFTRIPIEILKVGALGTHKTLGVAKEKGARLILASTSECYGDPAVHPQPEHYWGNVNSIGIRGAYDEAKRYAEAITMAYRRHHDLDTGIARIFNTYGPGMRLDDGRMIPNFFVQALRGADLTIYGTGSQTRSICYVDDLVDGLLRLARSSFPGPVNLGNPEELSVLELAERIRSLTGSSSRITFEAAAPDDPTRRCPDISVAKSILGWEPKVGPDRGLAHTHKYFASEIHRRRFQ